VAVLSSIVERRVLIFILSVHMATTVTDTVLAITYMYSDALHVTPVAYATLI
jgi:hypothetical protein